MTDYRYRLFGLTIASEFELPELASAPPSDTADVMITFDPPQPAERLSDEPTAIDGGFEIAVEGVARFAITGGDSIRVALDPSAQAANVRLFLLGSAFGMLLHQRDLLPLHANAVAIDGRAFAFLGRSGTGKSTLAAWFHDRGYAVVTDDVCVVRSDRLGRPSVSSGLPRLRLWRDALERSGRDPARFAASYSGDPDYDKFDIQFTPASSQALELAGIVQLGSGEPPGLSRLVGLAGVEALIANTYRGAYIGVLGRQRVHWQACVNLAASIPLFALGRVRGFEQLPAEIDAIVEWARDMRLDTRR